jgi:hypothetical protein
MVWAASSSAFDIRFAAMTVGSRLGKDGPGKGRRATWVVVEDHWGGGVQAVASTVEGACTHDNIDGGTMLDT